MKSDVINISGKECNLFFHPAANYLLIQPIDGHDLELLDQEVSIIQTLSEKPFSLVAFKINDWNQELSPWIAPPVFGKVPFGYGAKETLAFIINEMLPVLREKAIDTSHCLLGGYSLAGLFALWAGYQSDLFKGIVAASPSVWFPNWMDCVAVRKPFTNAIYLSLGDKEEKAKNPQMAKVGDAIRQQYELLKHQIGNTILEWNVGNHFVDSEKRMAKGFAWAVNTGYLL